MVLYCLVWPLWWVVYHMFCCCLCDKKADRRFRKPPEVGKIVRNLWRKKSEDNKIMSALVMLLKRSPQTLNKLEAIRVNPQLNRVLLGRSQQARNHRIKLRCDLEFYVPQLVAHYLRTDLDKNEVTGMKNFLLGCCRVSIFFAHRLWFNLQACSIISQTSSTPQTKEQLSRIVDLVTCLQVAPCARPTELLYLPQSDQIVKMLMRLNMGEELLEPECLVIAKHLIEQRALQDSEASKKNKKQLNLFS